MKIQKQAIDQYINISVLSAITFILSYTDFPDAALHNIPLYILQVIIFIIQLILIVRGLYGFFKVKSILLKFFSLLILLVNIAIFMLMVWLFTIFTDFSPDITNNLLF
jgi:hypothetical protein